MEGNISLMDKTRDELDKTEMIKIPYSSEFFTIALLII